MITLGRRSLLFGVHQFLWHPITILIAWWHLYGWPGWRELVCIVIHDWGYWFSPDKDGDHLYAEAKHDKLETGIPHVIETPKTCWECLCWGNPIGEDGLCDQCRDDMEFDEE